MRSQHVVQLCVFCCFVRWSSSIKQITHVKCVALPRALPSRIWISCKTICHLHSPRRAYVVSIADPHEFSLQWSMHWKFVKSSMVVRLWARSNRCPTVRARYRVFSGAVDLFICTCTCIFTALIANGKANNSWNTVVLRDSDSFIFGTITLHIYTWWMSTTS